MDRAWRCLLRACHEGLAEKAATIPGLKQHCLLYVICYLPPRKPTSTKTLKLFTLKQEQRKNRQAASNAASFVSSAQLRITKDINDLSLYDSFEVHFPDPDDLLKFKAVIRPDEGFYNGGRFEFTFCVGPNYPHEPPRVTCDTLVYHPNIDLEGNVCLNILRQEWSPVLTIDSLICGLLHLFLDPNPDDPLNKDAATTLATDSQLFERTVRMAMLGGRVGRKQFKNCLA